MVVQSVTLVFESYLGSAIAAGTVGLGINAQLPRAAKLLLLLQLSADRSAPQRSSTNLNSFTTTHLTMAFGWKAAGLTYVTSRAPRVLPRLINLTVTIDILPWLLEWSDVHSKKALDYKQSEEEKWI